MMSVFWVVFVIGVWLRCTVMSGTMYGVSLRAILLNKFGMGNVLCLDVYELSYEFKRYLNKI